LSGGSFAYTDKNVGAGNKTVTTTGVTVGDGINNGNYNVTYADNTTSTITQLASVTWTGGSQIYPTLWSDPSNWAGGVLPDGANVLQVVINSGGKVVYDSSVGSTTLQSLINHGSLTIADSSSLTVLSSLVNTSNFTLNVQGTLIAGFTTNTGTINILGGADPTFNATSGLNNMGGINIGDPTGSAGSSALNVSGTLSNFGSINSIGTVGSRSLSAGAMFNPGMISMSYPMTVGGVSYAAGSLLRTVDNNVVESITDIVTNSDLDNSEPVVLALNESEEKKKAEENVATGEGLPNAETTPTAPSLPVCQ
jgi:hypothetical protein